MPFIRGWGCFTNVYPEVWCSLEDCIYQRVVFIRGQHSLEEICYSLCNELLVLRLLENNPFKGIGEDEVCLEDIPGLPLDLGD